MTYEEALIKIKPLKNKKGEYEFWITLQDGFLPSSGRAKTVIDALRMSITHQYGPSYLDNAEVMSSFANRGGVSMPAIPESSQNEDADRWAVHALAAMLDAGKISKKMSLTWRGIKEPQTHHIKTNIEFSGRSAIGALKSLAIKHRAQSENLEAHRYGVDSFIHNLQLTMQQFFGFEAGWSKQQFFAELVYTGVIEVKDVDGNPELDWIMQ